jgi:4-aminobutyrate aminotransferase-like enzyme
VGRAGIEKNSFGLDTSAKRTLPLRNYSNVNGRVVYGNVVRIQPLLVIRKEQLDQVLHAVEPALEQIAVYAKVSA